MYVCMYVCMYVPVHIYIYLWMQTDLRQMSRCFLEAQGQHRAFCMAGAWEIIHTMLGINTRSSMYKRFSSTYQWLCHAKLKYKLAGGFPFRFSSTFWYFSLAIAVKSFVHTNFRLVHLNQKFDFLDGFGIFRICTAKRNSENARKIYILLVLLKMASYFFIGFSCVWHWNCAVHTKWPCAYILKCAYVLSWFGCFFVAVPMKMRLYIHPYKIIIRSDMQ